MEGEAKSTKEEKASVESELAKAKAENTELQLIFKSLKITFRLCKGTMLL